MYKTYFGLKENPFNINTDPRYLYLTQRTQEALNCLTYGIEARKGFILLTGEVGTGKTTLLNKLLDSLHQQRAATAFVFNPRMTASQLFDYMIADFGIACKSRARSHVLFKLHQWLLDRYQAGEQTVLVVDEAQILSRQTLEEIRLLTNLETSTQKLLQIVLAGQPEIEQKLNQRELRQLRQRIALRAKTLPLTPEETCGYILERLRIAGSNGEEIFTPAGDRGGAPACARNPARNQSAQRASAGQSVCSTSGNLFRRKSSRTLHAISAWMRLTNRPNPCRPTAGNRTDAAASTGRAHRRASRTARPMPRGQPDSSRLSGLRK